MTLNELRQYFNYLEKAELVCLDIFYISDKDDECNYRIRMWFDNTLNKFYIGDEEEKEYFDSFEDFVNNYIICNNKKVKDVLDDIEVDD